MIHGMNRSHLESQLDKLHATTYEFYLTGSRFFGTSTPNSDWDFFAQDHPAIQGYLENEGFNTISAKHAEKYMGISIQGCSQIYRKTFANGSIDVQLQLDVNRKLKAQNILKEFQEFFDLTNKNKRKAIWERALKLVS